MQPLSRTGPTIHNTDCSSYREINVCICMYICIYIYVEIDIDTDIDIAIHTDIGTDIDIDTNLQILFLIQIHIRFRYKYRSRHNDTCKNRYVYACTYGYIFICTHIYIYMCWELSYLLALRSCDVRGYELPATLGSVPRKISLNKLPNRGPKGQSTDKLNQTCKCAPLNSAHPSASAKSLLRLWVDEDEGTSMQTSPGCFWNARLPFQSQVNNRCNPFTKLATSRPASK